MPTYEYACEACGHQFEQVQSMRAAPLKKCPQCGKQRLERLVSGGSGFILKGAGFWRNDSKGKKSGAPSGITPVTKNANEKSTEKSSDKPAADSTTKPAATSTDKPAPADKNHPAPAQPKPNPNQK